MILCVGSINIDLVYRLPHIVQPGETLAAESFSRGLGGKGANQSIAAAKAGGAVAHCGAVGEDGRDMVEEMAAAGVDTSHVRVGAEATGHAIVAVDQAGENAIIIHHGANAAIGSEDLATSIATLGSEDWLILQNEVNVSLEAAEQARNRGARVVYSAAPFDADAVAEMVPHITHLLVNEIEFAALGEAGIAVPETVQLIVTLGAEGVRWSGPDGNGAQAAFEVEEVVDTTGAGDCFAGSLVAALDGGADLAEAARFAQAAAAIQITRPGAAPAMPEKSEVLDFLTAQRD